MNLAVAIPAYDGKVDIETARALLNEQALAQSLGWTIQFIFLPGGSLVTHARNQLAADFLASDAERLVFVDADVSWTLGELLRLARHGVDFVGGAYRYKDAAESYPVALCTDKAELWADPETGLLEVECVPGGFLQVSREVFARLKAAHPERTYSFGGKALHAYFHAPPGCGEDGTFCQDWRGAGGKVWLDPELELSHIGGRQTYTGHIGNWLKGRPR